MGECSFRGEQQISFFQLPVAAMRASRPDMPALELLSGLVASMEEMKCELAVS